MTRYKRPKNILLMPCSDGEFVLYTDYEKLLESIYKIKRNIAEWKKGCNNSSVEHPEDCPFCTVGLINAIEVTINNIPSLGVEDE